MANASVILTNNSVRNRPSVGIVYPRLHRGGSEAHAVWGLQALRGQYRTCFLTSDDVDLGPLNEFYGTEYRLRDICRD